MCIFGCVVGVCARARACECVQNQVSLKSEKGTRECKIGQRESGQRESGQRESGQRESRQRESGQRESGQRESGQREPNKFTG